MQTGGIRDQTTASLTSGQPAPPPEPQPPHVNRTFSGKHRQTQMFLSMAVSPHLALFECAWSDSIYSVRV